MASEIMFCDDNSPAINCRPLQDILQLIEHSKSGLCISDFSDNLYAKQLTILESVYGTARNVHIVHSSERKFVVVSLKRRNTRYVSS